MNKNRENRKKRYINAYVDGNTVKKVYESPLRKESIEKIKNKNIRKAQANSKAMGVTSFLTMFIAMAVASFFCIYYLNVESSMEKSIKRIEEMEQKLEKLTNENDAKEAGINAGIDLDEIYKTATGRLGMVYANKSRIIKYDKTESEYVRQYEDIPSR